MHMRLTVEILHIVEIEDRYIRNDRRLWVWIWVRVNERRLCIAFLVLWRWAAAIMHSSLTWISLVDLPRSLAALDIIGVPPLSADVYPTARLNTFFFFREFPTISSWRSWGVFGHNLCFWSLHEEHHRIYVKPYRSMVKRDTEINLEMVAKWSSDFVPEVRPCD